MGDSKESGLQASIDSSPNEIFKKMVVIDQDRRGSSGKINSTNQKTGYNGGKIRFIVCTLGLVSLAMSQMSRMVLNLSITSMVDPSMLIKADSSKISADGSCPWPEDSEHPSTTPSPSSAIDPILYYLTAPPDWFDQVASESEIESTTPYEVTTTTNNTLFEASKPRQDESVDKFKWSIKQQSTLLGGFYYSYFFFMILGKTN